MKTKKCLRPIQGAKAFVLVRGTTLIRLKTN